MNGGSLGLIRQTNKMKRTGKPIPIFVTLHNILIEVHKGLTVKNTDPSSTSIKKRIRIRKNKN